MSADLPPLPIWECKTSDGRWKPCDSQTALAAEQAFAASTSAKQISRPIIINQNPCIFNFWSMELMDLATQTRIRVRRLLQLAEWERQLPVGLAPKRDREFNDDAPPPKKVRFEAKPAEPAPLPVRRRAVVDIASGLQGKAHVYEAGGLLYQCLLTQATAATFTNKFYVLQVLESNESGIYWLYVRWGRVGDVGDIQLFQYLLPTAIDEFKKRFAEKTSNAFGPSVPPITPTGPFREMDLDLTSPSSVVVAKQLPVGQISKKQIKAAFSPLFLIEEELRKPTPPSVEKLTAWSSVYFTLLPHNLGGSRVPVIADWPMLQAELALLDSMTREEGEGKGPLDAYRARPRVVRSVDAVPLRRENAFRG